MTDTAPHTEEAPTPPPPAAPQAAPRGLRRWLTTAPPREPLWIGLATTAFFLLLIPSAGIWEPWEAARAYALTQMSEGSWLKVLLPLGEGQESLKAIPRLPFALWPQLATVKIFGLNEWGLRLPSALMAGLVVALLFCTTRRFYGRLSAYFATISLLAMPLFGLHTRFALGNALEAGFVALAVLAFIRLSADAEASPRWAWLAWPATAAAALSSGAPGLAIPLCALAALTFTPRGDAGASHEGTGGLRRLFAPLPLILAVALIALGWWRAAAHRPEGTSLNLLLLLADGFGQEATTRSPFHLFFHQLGFGLFPFGAFIPLALADLLWRPAPAAPAPQSAQSAVLAYRPTALALAAAFAAAFLAPAVGLSYSGFGAFLGAPFAAILIGLYLSRALREPPEPLRVIVAVLFVALIDSNLKHETRMLADLIVGGPVDAFPPKLPYWPLARVLNMALLGLLMLYQGNLLRWISPPLRWLLYPARPIPYVSARAGRTWLSAALALGLGILLAVRAPGPIERLLSAAAWARVLPIWRTLALIVAIALLTHTLLWALWNLRARQLSGRTEGALSRGLGRLIERLSPWPVAAGLGLTLCLLWVVFLDGVAAAVLTENFSQKPTISRYEALAKPGEPLYRYRLDESKSSFYAAALPQLTPKAFQEKAKESERFFALMPRNELSRANTSFRDSSGRTLPVLDDKSYRILLVSNQLREGEVDLNPINRALVKTLPPNARQANASWGDDIDLIGWRLDPPQPRPGSPLDIHLFWQAKKKIPHNWQIFIHIDAPGQRIHGDHHPVEGLYPTQNWAPGDIVHDVHRIVVARTITPAPFTFYVGLYRGSERKPVTSTNKDRDNRANIGSIRVR